MPDMRMVIKIICMSKTKSSENQRYETLCIISNKYSEEEVKPIVEKIKKFITDNQGKISHEENWGKKRLAYPIKGFGYGYYNLFEFEVDGASVGKIDRNLKLMAEVIRHQTVRKEVSAKKPRLVMPKTRPAAKPLKEEAPAKERPKTDLKDLDEKLDKILETSDLL